jgi:hypothetical protein
VKEECQQPPSPVNLSRTVAVHRREHICCRSNFHRSDAIDGVSLLDTAPHAAVWFAGVEGAGGVLASSLPVLHGISHQPRLPRPSLHPSIAQLRSTPHVSPQRIATAVYQLMHVNLQSGC